MTDAPADGPLRVLIGMNLGGLEGGAERLLLALLHHAPDAGLDVHLVSFQEGALVDSARAAGIRVTVVPIGHHRDPVAGLRAIARVRSIIAAEDPEVILSWLALAHVWLAPAAVLARRRRRLVWWQFHIARGEPLEALIAWFPAARVIACSHAAAAAQEARWPHRRCLVVHPGIDPPEEPRPGELAGLREDLGIRPGTTLVGTAGRLVRWKGHHHFIDAIAELRGIGRDVTGLVVGGENYGLDAGYFDELKALARERGVEGDIIFTGHVPNPHPYVALVDVLVSASDGEPFGVTLLEAMSLGTPMVAVARGGPVEILEDGESGILVPDDSGRSLAAGVERILADPALAERIVVGGRARFEELFTAERNAIETERALRPVGARRRVAV
jgi:glycosyltransferase involved in cell wall biosynthesis